MILNSIKLSNFRIHKDTKIDFSPRINYIIGGNGHGKTSLLEALYLICTTKSFKASSDSELLRFDQSEYSIDAVFSDISSNNLRVYYSFLDNKKVFTLNKKIVSKSTELIGKFPVVLLTPADHSLTQGNPSERRKFIDSVISQVSETYLNSLIEYNKILKNRSSLLSLIYESNKDNFASTRSYGGNLLEELDAWDERLVEEGSIIYQYRNKFIESFNPFIIEAYSKIVGIPSSELSNENNNETIGDEIPSIFYQSDLAFKSGAASNTDLNDSKIKENFRLILKSIRNDEIRRKINLTGPHKDDLIFMINNKNLRTFGSQGQHKSFQVALRFAQFFYIKEKLGTDPIILLDDVFGELDSKRASLISKYLDDLGQTFITLTDFSNFSFLPKNSNDLLIQIKNGNSCYV